MDLVARQDLIGSTPVVALGGIIDLGSIPVLHDRLRRAVLEHPGSTVAIDLDGVISLDDCGLGVILGVAGLARERGGDLALVCTSERLRARLHLTGLDRAVDVRAQL